MPASRFLVDTSGWICALRKDFIPEIKDRLDQLLEADLVITAGIIKLEILGGTRREKEFKLLKKRVDALPLTGSRLSCGKRASPWPSVSAEMG